MTTRSRFLSQLGGAAIAGALLPHRVSAAVADEAKRAPERVLYLSNGGSEYVHAAFTMNGGTKYDLQGYYKLCIVFRDADPGVAPSVGYVQIDPNLIDALWEIQRYYKETYGVDPRVQPIDVFSGFRTPATNERVGGAPASYHLLARAVDFAVRGVPAWHTGKAALALPTALAGGVGIYVADGHVHVDTGPRKNRVWCGKEEATCPSWIVGPSAGA